VREIFGKFVCETIEEVLFPDWCAVLAIDLQNDAFRPEGKLAKAGKDISMMVEVLPRCAHFINQARSLAVPVVHIRIVDLPEGKSDSPAWLRSKRLMSGLVDFFMEGTWGAEICEECAPLPGELVVTKHRSSAFVGTNVDQLLRARGVVTVVVIGEQTPGCVEATYRDAAYHDYYNVLIEHCVAAFDRELHEASIKIQKARHDVCTASEVLDIWRKYRAGVLPPPSNLGTQISMLT
jgi:nicotinamidase-related amidase